jgi:hypothetical protein
MSELQGMFPRL